MDSIKYTQRIKNNDRLAVKQIILAVCAVGLLVILAGTAACLSNKNYYDLIWYAVGLVIIFVLQFSTTFLCYELIVDYDSGAVRVRKSYAGILREIFNVTASDMTLKKYDENLDGGQKIIALCPKSCAGAGYVVKLSGKNYLVNFDDYIYSLIEVAHDIS